jgi:superfamily II DNA or RNA helicase
VTEFPKNIQFKYRWRNYQQRVLDELQSHFTDGHLHIIAPPGSGKTVLGLEVALRLNKPTLILAPTLAIKNQWVQRFCELFLDTHTVPVWISRDIRQPKFMTVATYQGLHAACQNWRGEDEMDNDEEEETEGETLENATNPNLEKIVNGLKEQKIETIIVDEAHHLKNEWWQTLTRIKEKINPFIVGLTATPPYDVSALEWHRYITLNGPVDTEISVPELVIANDLCPHQDYVFFTLPTTKEQEGILAFRQNAQLQFAELSKDVGLLQAIEEHPAWIYPAGHLSWIYNNLSYYSACLIYMHANGKEIPETHLEIIGDKNVTVPDLDIEWMETLLDFYLYNDKEHFKNYEDHKRNVENRLRRYGIIEKRQISFSQNKRLSATITTSISKLKGISEIVDFEYQQLGKDLRMVILSDYIRKEFFTNATENTIPLNKLGVIPIFEALRRNNAENKKIGVLTGSMVIIPESACAAFEAKALAYGLTGIKASPVSFDPSYLLVSQTEQLKHDIVHIVTQIFQAGEIEVLIGTKALLGEGWDAPAINALILASFVGSYVLSNQMRGRAIRTQKGNIEKTSNIWHLACIDPTSPGGGDDFELLKRRFKSFVGVSFREEPGIENGIGRLNLPDTLGDIQTIEAVNQAILSAAADRESLSKRWMTALESGVKLVEELKIPFPEKKEYTKVKSLYFNKTIAYLLATLGMGIMGYLDSMLQVFGRFTKSTRNIQELYFFFTVVVIGGILFFGREAYKAFRLYIKYRDIGKDIFRIGDALLNSLIKAGAIHTDKLQLSVEYFVDRLGGVYCHLEGGTTYESSTFINNLQEIIAPIDNPRYVIIRKSRSMLLKRQKDYHSVPEILGRNKTLAEHFFRQWEQLVGPCELIFTRTMEGREMLLKARIKSLAAQIDETVEHVSIWR